MSQRNGKITSGAKTNSFYVYIILVIMVLASAAVIYYFAGINIGQASTKATAPSSLQASARYLNLSDISTLLPGSQYAAIMQGNTSTFIPQLQSEGYLGSTASLFELQNPKQFNGTKYPAVIVSDVLRISNQTAAKQLFSSMFFSNNVNQLNGSLVYNLPNYSSPKGTIHIYTTYSVAVFNNSIAKMLNITDTHMPDFQYASIFRYNNTIDAVYADNYVQSSNFSNVSIALAETLARKIAG